MIAPLLLSVLSLLQAGRSEGEAGSVRPAAPLPAQADQPVAPNSLSLVVLDEQGEVPKGLVVRAQAYVGEEVVGGYFEVPENGRLLVEVPPALRRSPCLRVAVVPSEMNSPVADWSRAGILDLPEEQAGLDLDLGEVRLGSAPVMFAGRVVDDRGEPVVGARVIVDSQKYSGGADTEELFETLLITAVTDADGGFVVRGRAGWSPAEIGLRVAADADGHQQMIGEVLEAPREDLELTLPRAGHAVLSWILPRSAQGASLGIQFLPMDADPDAALITRWSRPELPRPKLAPGAYRLRLLDDGDNIIYEVEDVQVLPGEPCPDDRIRDIDLTERVKAVRLTVIEQAGRVLETPFQVWQAKQRHGRHGRAGWRGTPREEWWLLLAAGATADVYVSARTYRPQVIEGVSQDRVVEMQRTLGLTLQIVGTEVFEKDGRFLGVALLPYPVPDEGSSFRPGYAVELVGAGPVRQSLVTASLPAPGEYLVRWNVYERSPDGRPLFLGRVDGDLLEISEEDDQTTIETPLPPEVWTLEKQ